MLSCWGASFPSYRCCTSKCPACGVSTSFPIRSLRACCPPFTAIRAGCEAPLGCGDRRRNGDDPVPRLQRPYHLGDPVRALRRCGSRRQVHYAALHTLTITHVDCDAFDATVAPSLTATRPTRRLCSTRAQPRRIELAVDQIRARLGDQSVQFGCGLPTAGNTSHPTAIRR